jgi:hypothetical protein
LKHRSSLCEALMTIIVSSAYWMIGKPDSSLEGIGIYKRCN